MGKTAILAIRIIGDATAAVASLDKVDGSAKSMQASMDKASIGAGIALGALTAAAAAAGQAASDLQQATGAVDSVFGSYADKVHEYASTAADDVGLAADQYENLSAVLGSQLKNMGVSMDAVGGQSADLIKLGADLSAMFGGTAADAVAALSSLLRGERDPIERYGVSMKQVDIDAQKAAMGLSGLTGEADKAATTQATLALLQQQTAAATGQFGREADTASGQQQRATASWRDAQAALGEQLLPVMTEGAQLLSEMAKWAGENNEVVTVMALTIGGLAAAILIANGATKAFAAAQGIATAAQWLFNAAQLANPVTLIVLAIVLAVGVLIAIVLLMIQNWDEVSRVAADVWGGVMDWMDGVIGMVRDVLGWFGKLGDAIGSLFSGGGWDKLGDLFGGGFAANVMVESGPVAASPLAFSNAEAFAGFSGKGFQTEALSSFAAPSLPASLGEFATGTDARTTTTINLTINGAIDKDGTARTIIDALNDYYAQNGTTVAAGVRRQ